MHQQSLTCRIVLSASTEAVLIARIIAHLAALSNQPRHAVVNPGFSLKELTPEGIPAIYAAMSLHNISMPPHVPEAEEADEDEEAANGKRTEDEKVLSLAGEIGQLSIDTPALTQLLCDINDNPNFCRIQTHALHGQPYTQVYPGTKVLHVLSKVRQYHPEHESVCREVTDRLIEAGRIDVLVNMMVDSGHDFHRMIRPHLCDDAERTARFTACLATSYAALEESERREHPAHLMARFVAIRDSVDEGSLEAWMSQTLSGLPLPKAASKRRDGVVLRPPLNLEDDWSELHEDYKLSLKRPLDPQHCA